MSLVATLVVGANGATSKGGSSQALSTNADRRRFLELHRSAGAIIVGANSFNRESYANTKAPVYIFTREPTGRAPHELDVSSGFTDAIKHITSHHSSPIVIECGVSLMIPLIESGAVNSLQLTISPIDGDGDFIELSQLLSHFDVMEEVEIDGTRLLECRYKGYASDSENNS